MTRNLNGCACDECIAGCWQSCGWFGTITEVEGAAAIMGLSPPELAQQYLIREWWAGKEDIYVPAPRKDFSRLGDNWHPDHSPTTISYFDHLGPHFYTPGTYVDAFYQQEFGRNGPGFVVATWAHNLLPNVACIFLTQDQRCRIHASKPKECRVTMACKDTCGDRKAIVRYWAKHQGYVKTLLQN